MTPPERAAPPVDAHIRELEERLRVVEAERLGLERAGEVWREERDEARRGRIAACKDMSRALGERDTAREAVRELPGKLRAHLADPASDCPLCGYDDVPDDGGGVYCCSDCHDVRLASLRGAATLSDPVVVAAVDAARAASPPAPKCPDHKEEMWQSRFGKPPKDWYCGTPLPSGARCPWRAGSDGKTYRATAGAR